MDHVRPPIRDGWYLNVQHIQFNVYRQTLNTTFSLFLAGLEISYGTYGLQNDFQGIL